MSSADLRVQGNAVSKSNAVPTNVASFKISGTITRPADTTAYSIGDAVTDSTSAPTTGSITVTGASSGQFLVITKVVVISSAKQSTLPLFNLHLFAVTFTATNDNAALDIAQAVYETGGLVLALDTQNSVASRSRVAALNQALPFQLDAADTKIYWALQAANTYTPVSGEKFTLVLYGYLL